MSRPQKFFLFLLQIFMGWLFFYAGVTKIFPGILPQQAPVFDWSAAGYLEGAKTFTSFYHFLAQPNILPVIDFVNQWGLMFLGVSLILGVFVRISSILGAILMLLYYLPILDFPYPNPNSLIVDQHVVYMVVLLYLAAVGSQAGLIKFFRLFKT